MLPAGGSGAQHPLRSVPTVPALALTFSSDFQYSAFSFSIQYPVFSIQSTQSIQHAVFNIQYLSI